MWKHVYGEDNASDLDKKEFLPEDKLDGTDIFLGICY